MQTCAATPTATGHQELASLFVRLFPILFFEAYLLSSLLGFVFSPVEEFWVNELLPVILYALLGQGFLLVGYCWGATHPPCSYAGPWRSQVVLQITIAVTVLVFIAALWFRNDSGLSLSEALADSGAAYAARVEGLQQRTTLPLFSFCRGFVGPVLGLFVPLGIVYRNQMSRAWQVLWGLGTAGMVIDGLLTGAAKGLFDIVLLIPWFLWLSLRQGGVRPTQTARRKPSFLKRCVIIAIALLVLALGINYFASSRQSRYGLSGSDYPPGTTGWSKEQYGIGLPPGLEYTTYMILAYWTGGYCGLAGCLELPFQWCYGCGHSFVLMRYLGYLSPHPDFFYDRCYPARLECTTGYSAESYWHTIYPWLASDLTFPGALVFMGLMAYLLARAWSDSLRGDNPFALGFLAQILLMFYYIPCNNVRLQFAEEIITFWGLLVLWLGTRKG